MQKYKDKNLDYEKRMFEFLIYKNGKAFFRELCQEVFDSNVGLTQYYMSENMQTIKYEKGNIYLTGKSQKYLKKSKLIKLKLCKN